MSGYLTDKCVLIIGGGSGIGRATALIAAREGARVVIGDIAPDSARAVAEAIGPNATFIALDVCRAEMIAAAVQLASDWGGRLDGLVNCAAKPEPFRGLLDASEADFAAIIDVNLRGTWLAMRAGIACFRAQGGGGAIVNVASTAGLKGSQSMAIYSASKHGVIGLTRSAARECAKAGPRINAICPGVIDTPMMQDVASDPRARRAFEASLPNGRLGLPDEVGETCAWLLSNRASLVNGAILGVDGGATA